jgi:hypothetical protein
VCVVALCLLLRVFDDVMMLWRIRDSVPSSPHMCVSVVCGAQASFRQPDLERVVCFIRGTRQPDDPVSVRCCAVLVLRMCDYV